MDQKSDFNTLLSALVEEAMANGNTIDKSHIDDEFTKIGIAENLLENIYSYFKNNNIKVTGITIPASSPVLEEEFGIPDDFDISKEEEDFVQMYFDDVNSIENADHDTHVSCIKALFDISSGSSIKNQLAQYNLHIVTDLLPSYSNKGIASGDLIQEGNLGLLEGIASFQNDIDSYNDLNDEQLLTAFISHITFSIKESMNKAVDNEFNAGNISSHLADRANLLDKASRELASKLNRQPSLEELSKYTGLTEEEVENTLKYSIDAMTISVDVPDEENNK